MPVILITISLTVVILSISTSSISHLLHQSPPSLHLPLSSSISHLPLHLPLSSAISHLLLLLLSSPVPAQALRAGSDA